MGPVYAHCPHCTFPVVVAEGEEKAGRYCRQCRRLFVPAECLVDDFPASGRKRTRSRKHLAAWRTILSRTSKNFLRQEE